MPYNATFTPSGYTFTRTRNENARYRHFLFTKVRNKPPIPCIRKLERTETLEGEKS